MNIVAIAGWSPAGKVAIIQKGLFIYPAWLILDTVTDEVLDAANTSAMGESKNSLYSQLNKVCRRIIS